MIKVSITPDRTPVEALVKCLARELSQILDISEEALATDEPFSYFGLDSAKAVSLMDRLGTFMGRKIPLALAWRYPTIGSLAAYLSHETESASRESSTPMYPDTSWSQPVAVIGIACRFPGALDPVAFWNLLRSGRSAFREITSDRWDSDALYDPDLRKAGRMNARMAGLLDRIDEFDPGFFGISPREAIQMDPQQRLALELVPDDLSTLLRADMDSYLRAGSGGLLAPWIEKIRARWNINDELIADFLDGLLVVPVLALLTKRGLLKDLPKRDFADLPEGVRNEVVSLFEVLGWLEGSIGHYRLTAPGEFMFERAMNLGVVEFVEGRKITDLRIYPLSFV